MSGSNYMLRIRLTKQQEERLRAITQAEGYTTMSQFARDRLFQSLSVDLKLNNILKLLEENKKGSLREPKEKIK